MSYIFYKNLQDEKPDYSFYFFTFLLRHFSIFDRWPGGLKIVKDPDWWQVNAVHQAPDGGFFIAGLRANEWEFFVAKTDSAGDISFSFPANSVNENPGLPSSPQPPDCSNIQNLPPNTTCYPTGTFFYVTVDPSDATVTAASAKDLPGRNQLMEVEMKGTNHIEMRNNSETKNAFDQLFDGDVNPHFKVEKN